METPKVEEATKPEEDNPVEEVLEAPITDVIEECPVCEHDMCQCPEEPKVEIAKPIPWNALKMVRPMNGPAHDHGHSVRGARR